MEEKPAVKAGVKAAAKSIQRGADKKPSVPVFKDWCWRCEAEVELNFKPDGKRPVYCKECLKGSQKEKARAEKSGILPAVFQSVPAKPELKQAEPKPVEPAPTNTKDGLNISLNEAIRKDQKERVKAKPREPQKKEFDLSGLRETLNKVLKKADVSVEDKVKDPTESEPPVFKEKKPVEESKKPARKGELKAGESVDLG